MEFHVQLKLLLSMPHGCAWAIAAGVTPRSTSWNVDDAAGLKRPKNSPLDSVRRNLGGRARNFFIYIGAGKIGSGGGDADA